MLKLHLIKRVRSNFQLKKRFCYLPPSAIYIRAFDDVVFRGPVGLLYVRVRERERERSAGEDLEGVCEL